MNAKLKYGLIAFLGMAAIGAFLDKPNQYPQSQSSSSNQPVVTEVSPTTPQPTTQEIYQTTAKQLYSDYDKNEVATDEILKNKKVIISGEVQSIDKDMLDNIVVQLKTSNQFSPATMQMNDSEKAMTIKLNKNDKVSITCEKITRIIGSPSGANCIFTN